MSSAIARLERDLGVALFDRSVTPVALTEHGAALRAGAQRILDAVQVARDDVAAVSGQVRGTVTLALYHLWSDPMVFVCRPDHPLGDRDRLAVPDLGDEMILRFPPGWGVRAAVSADRQLTAATKTLLAALIQGSR